MSSAGLTCHVVILFLGCCVDVVYGLLVRNVFHLLGLIAKNVV